MLAPRFPLEFCTRVFLCFACSAFPSAPFEFVRSCLSRFVMRTLPHKHRVCAVLFSRFPFQKVCTLIFLAFCCYAYFPSQTSGLCSAFPSAPLLSLYAYLCRVMLCVFRLTNISFVQCSSLGSLLSFHAYIGHVLSKQSNLFLLLLSTSKRFSRFSVPDAFYKSRKAKSQRVIGLHSRESIFIIFAP